MIGRLLRFVTHRVKGRYRQPYGSPAAIDLARRHPDVNGVSDRVHFQVCGDLKNAFSGEQFYVVMGFAVLHHLSLQRLVQHIHVRVKVGGIAAFAVVASCNQPEERLP